jgi:oligopeptide transport system ATP-binding protein
MSAAISIRDAKLRFGHTLALDGVTLDVAPRDCFGLVGESGSGKTTLMRVILGLERLQSGGISLLDTPLKSGNAPAWCRRSSRTPPPPCRPADASANSWTRSAKS